MSDDREPRNVSRTFTGPKHVGVCDWVKLAFDLQR